MDIEDVITGSSSPGPNENEAEINRGQNNKINQNQFYDLITGNEVSWQAVIYDLVKTEQLDPWNIDLGVLADKYVIVVQEMEEANFLVSSKVLHACALLLRLKSEFLSSRYLQELDDALYGKREGKRYEPERIEIDEDELPILTPRSPMPRFKKVTLNELMSALNQAIETENRRIRKDIKVRQAEKSALVVMPKRTRVPLKDRIKEVFARLQTHIAQPDRVHMTFSELAPTKEEKLASFVPVLHLANNEKLWLRQEKHFDEVYILLEKIYEDIECLEKDIVEIKENQEREVNQES